MFINCFYTPYALLRDASFLIILVVFETRLSFLAVSFNLAVTNVKNSFKSHVNSYNAKTEAEQCCE